MPFTEQTGGTHTITTVDTWETLVSSVTVAGLFHLEIDSFNLVVPEVALIRIQKVIRSGATQRNGPVYSIGPGEPDISWPIPIFNTTGSFIIQIQQVGGTARAFVWSLGKAN